MRKEIRFTFLVDDEERELIRKIAERLNRSQSDAVRLIVVNAARGLLGENGTETEESEATNVHD